MEHILFINFMHKYLCLVRTLGRFFTFFLWCIRDFWPSCQSIKSNEDMKMSMKEITVDIRDDLNKRQLIELYSTFIGN